MEFFARLMADMLSILIILVSNFSLPSSSIEFINQLAWQALNDASIYSASHDESATTGSFLPRNWAPPTRKMYHAADFLSSMSPHQFESVYPRNLQLTPLSIAGNRILLSIVPVIYEPNNNTNIVSQISPCVAKVYRWSNESSVFSWIHFFLLCILW